MPLVSHLGNHFGILPGCLHDQFRLQESAAQRLLHIYMLAFGHRHHHGRKMRKVGRGNGHRLNLVAHLVEHLAEVPEAFRVGEFGKCFLCVFCTQINIAQGNHVGQSGFIEIVHDLPPSVADTNVGKVHFLIGTHHPVVACGIHFGRYTSHGQSRRCQCCISEKLSSCCHDNYINCCFSIYRSRYGGSKIYKKKP